MRPQTGAGCGCLQAAPLSPAAVLQCQPWRLAETGRPPCCAAGLLQAADSLCSCASVAASWRALRGSFRRQRSRVFSAVSSAEEGAALALAGSCGRVGTFPGWACSVRCGCWVRLALLPLKMLMLRQPHGLPRSAPGKHGVRLAVHLCPRQVVSGPVHIPNEGTSACMAGLCLTWTCLRISSLPSCQ